MQKVVNAIQRVRFTKSTTRQASIRRKAVDKCLFPHHEVVDNQTKKPKKGYYSHKRRESDDKNAVAIVKMLVVFQKLLGWKLERSRIRKSIHVTSPPTKDLFEIRMEKRIGFRTCSTTVS